MGTGDDDCIAESIAAPEHWALADCIAIVNVAHKKIGSAEDHSIAGTSPLQNARVADTPRRLDILVRRMMANDKQAAKALVPFGALAVDQITSETTAQFSDYLKRAKELSVLPTGSYEYRSAQEPMGYEREVLYQCIRSLCNFDMPGIETFLAKLYHGATMLLLPLEREGLDQNEFESTGIRQSIIWAFEYFGGKGAVDIIISGLQDGDTTIRYAALTTQRSCLTESATITSLSRNPYFSKRLTSR